MIKGGRLPSILSMFLCICGWKYHDYCCVFVSLLYKPWRNLVGAIAYCLKGQGPISLGIIVLMVLELELGQR